MSKHIGIAAIQLDANPTPLEDRLQRAHQQVSQAAGQGAELVVLPELFNIGYDYHDDNFGKAETIDGRTVTWMRDTAVAYQIHLAGTLLLWEEGEIFNALLLLAPDGRMWRYDKNYPWGWERGYFRGRDNIVIAETDLGDIGFLICWDSAHPGLWRSYAGKVDLMVIASCPPKVTDPIYHFPDGTEKTMADLGPVMGLLRDGANKVFGDMINEQTAWLGVPTVNSVGCGRIRTKIPNGLGTVGSMITIAPHLLPYLPQASQLEMSCDLTEGCKVVSASGEVQALRTQAEGEGFTLATVAVPEQKPQPQKAQPKRAISWFAYFNSDFLLPMLTARTYRRGVALRNAGE